MPTSSTKDVNRSWCLSMLRKFVPGHMFFKEDYMYVRPKKQGDEQEAINGEYNAYKDAFGSIPLPKKRAKRTSVTGNMIKRKTPTK